jgi:hypothetical protein
LLAGVYMGVYVVCSIASCSNKIDIAKSGEKQASAGGMIHNISRNAQRSALRAAGSLLVVVVFVVFVVVVVVR